MRKFLITGVSSGIGKALTVELIKRGHSVWGIARRKNLLIELKKDLGNSKDFLFSSLDVAKSTDWRILISRMRSSKYRPQVVIFNAAILENDIRVNNSIDLATTRKIMETNYFSILSGLNDVMKFLKKKTKIIFIGSSAAFKGSGQAGVGYSSSKAALNSAFESLHQRLGKTFDFKIIHFGPVKTAMVPFSTKVMFMQTPEKAAEAVIRAVDSENHIFFSPWLLFFFLRLIKLLPSRLYLTVFNYIDSVHQRHRKQTS